MFYEGLSTSSVDVAERTGTMLSSIVPEIRRTAELVQEINASSREQESGVEQINKAIQQLDRVTRQNASASEEMASTAEELSAQAAQLQEAVAYFKIGDAKVSPPSQVMARTPKATPKTSIKKSGSFARSTALFIGTGGHKLVISDYSDLNDQLETF